MREPRGHPFGEQRADLAARAGLRANQFVRRVDLRREIDVNRLARAPVARNLQDARPGQSAMGEQDVLDELTAAPLRAGRHPRLERHARQRGERRPRIGRKGQRHERRPRIDELVAELFRDPVSEIGRADLRDRQSARRDDERLRADRARARIEREAVRLRVPHRVDRHRPPPCDAARVALAFQHVDDRVARMVAKELTLVLLVPRDAMVLQESEKIARRVARERRAAEMRIRGQIVVRPRVQIREIAAPAARDADLLREPWRVIEQHDAPPELPRHRSRHHAGRARADHRDIEFFHGADCTRVACPFARAPAGEGAALLYFSVTLIFRPCAHARVDAAAAHHHARSRHRKLLRRNRPRALRHRARPARARASLADRDAPRIRRCRSRARVARPHSPRAAAARRGARRKRRAPRRHRRDRVHAGARPRGRAARRREHRERARVRVGQADHRHPSPRRASAVAAARRRAAAVSVRRAARVGRPYATDARERRRRLRDARRDARRCRRRSVRQDREAARPRLSGRAGGIEARGSRHPGRGRAAAADASFGGSRLQLQRAEDRRAHANEEARSGARGRRRARTGEGGSRARLRRRGRRRARREVARRVEDDAAQAARRRRRRGREPAIARGAVGRRPKARLRRPLSRSRALHRQRRDDRARGRAAARALAVAGEPRLRVHGEAALGSRVARAIAREARRARHTEYGADAACGGAEAATRACLLSGPPDAGHEGERAQTARARRAAA
ncbi:putative O-sialoglycoendopeptidase domain protein [Burkholderia pseudomallei TSV32]|nr:putative O-sialoglycoendopeptidase domain protein [Burkholderia pseudomallei TSV32]